MHISIAEFESCLGDVSFPLAVATSGGVDSLALLLLTHTIAKQRGERLIALTIDHGLRDQSNSEALKVQQWAQEKEIEHIILKWDGPKPISRLQEKAREARYQLLLQWCKENRIPTLLLGHHQQDQEETFWLRLSAGSGLEGLVGMKKKIIRQGIVCLRPLLGFSKECLVATVKAEKQTWIEDPSNQNTLFFRGRFRSFLKEEGLSPQRLVKTMEKLQIDADFIQDSLQKVIKATVQLCEGGYISVQKSVFQELHPALARRLISFLMQWYSGAVYPPRSSQVEIVIDNINLSSPFTAGGIYWFLKQNEILLLRELSAVKDKIFLSDLQQPRLWDHRYWVDAQIQKKVSPETILAPLGAISSLKKEIISSIPSQVWPTLPALWVKGKIVSIPQFGYNVENKIDYGTFFYLKPLF